MLKFRTLLPLLALALLTSCASLVGPRDIELPLTKLQSGLERRFPISNRMLELFDVELSRPQLSLQSDAGRVGLSLDAVVAPAFLRQSWRGNLGLSGRLYIDPVRNAVMMAEPRVETFTVDGVDAARQRQLTGVANVLMEKVVLDTPLYHFRPDDLRYGGVQFVPTRIATSARGLVVTVEPAK
ncbi:DUF1439 domain-containing protein [Massilia sp. CF038]|uniref:DUF1439 domain-containing protein n=1 Tax=Massilia sp. CF038 TaxID=1881045 RepID=UPI001E5A774C|nr:DUF1439 domain-containing protein [Massilia sp. CF038]